MLIGILQCGHAPDMAKANRGDYDAMFAALLSGHGFEFQTWNVVDMEFPRGPNDADGWLLTGSRHGAYETHPFIEPLSSLIQEIYRSEKPMVGVCFGHQIIAQALGGHVEKFKDGWALGHQTYTYKGDQVLDLNAWHQDQVVTAPSDASPIAGNEFCKNAALIYGKKALTYQPHPEFPGDVIDALIQAKRGTADYPDDLMDIAADNLNNATDHATIATDIAQFFKGKFEVMS